MERTNLDGINKKKSPLYQHFFGCEIETDTNCFNENILELMNFDCVQNKGLHFFYILPFSKNRALIETTWYSKNIKTKKEYKAEIDNYLIEKNITGKIDYEEFGAIPLNMENNPDKNTLDEYVKIGSAGNLTRASTGYTFQAIQTFSEQLVNNIKSLNKPLKPNIRHKKYDFLDNIFLTTVEHDYQYMPTIFFNLFKYNTNTTTINFLSDRSDWFQDLKVVLSMPKLIFIKNFIRYIYIKIKN